MLQLGCGPQSSLIGYGKRKKRDVKELPQTVEVEVHHEITVMDEGLSAHINLCNANHV